MSDLQNKSDSELAQWQSGWKEGTHHHILAEKEWARRLAMRQLDQQFRLEERLSNSDRRWSILAAFIGVAGTLAGAWLGASLSSKDGPTEPFDLPGSSETAIVVTNAELEIDAHYRYLGNDEFEKLDVIDFEDLPP